MYKGSTDKRDGRGGGATPQAPPLDFFFSTLPPSPEDRPWQLLGWAPNFDVREPEGLLGNSLGSSLA